MTETELRENTCSHCRKPLLPLPWENSVITHVLVCDNILCPQFASPQGVVKRTGLYMRRVKQWSGAYDNGSKGHRILVHLGAE